MITSFEDKETEGVFNRIYSEKFPFEIQDTANRKLRMLNRAKLLTDLRVPPKNRFEMLKGVRKGQFSIRVNNDWRIIFKLNSGDKESVALIKD